MSRLLVTGASGFLGWHICREAIRQGWQVGAVKQSNQVGVEGVTELSVDLRERGQVERVFREFSPDAVIHAAALANPNICEQQPVLSYAVNVDATAFVCELCADIPLIFTSTDLVFDGEHAPYSEEDAVGPLMVYGRHKVEAENIVRKNSHGLVCRMPLMFGMRGDKPAGFTGPWFAKLERGEKLTLFVDEYRTPVGGQDAARGLLIALNSGIVGTLHIGGPDRISRYEFGLAFCEAFGFSQELIEPVPQNSVSMPAPRARDVALDSSRAFALGYDPARVTDPGELRWMLGRKC